MNGGRENYPGRLVKNYATNPWAGGIKTKQDKKLFYLLLFLKSSDVEFTQ